MNITDFWEQFKKKDTVICAGIALTVVIVAITFGLKKDNAVASFAESTVTPSISESRDRESRLEETLSLISGVGKVNVLITYDSIEESKPVAAIVIAEGATEPEARILLQLAVQTSLGLEASNIKIFEMRE